jgi:hypothetical protein
MNKFFIIIGLILLCAFGFAQEAEEPIGDEVDMSGITIEIKPQPDRPRVTIYPERIKPEFDTVNLEKSFMPELVGKGERIELVENSASKQTTVTQSIDIDKVVNKPRKQ